MSAVPANCLLVIFLDRLGSIVFFNNCLCTMLTFYILEPDLFFQSVQLRFLKDRPAVVHRAGTGLEFTGSGRALVIGLGSGSGLAL